jgi:hypothetical protein
MKYRMKLVSELRPQLEPLELADTLHRQAEQLLAEIRLVEALSPYGAVTPTGSYYLNVMVYPDIDIYLPKLSVEQVFAIGGQMACNEKVIQVVFEQGDAMMPGGLYLKLRIANIVWGRPWKLDLWSLEPELFEQKMVPMRHFLACMTPELRLQIIQFKLSVLTPALRTPMYSGYFIYKAFIDERLTDFDDITRYLVANGIRVG